MSDLGSSYHRLGRYLALMDVSKFFQGLKGPARNPHYYGVHILLRVIYFATRICSLTVRTEREITFIILVWKMCTTEYIGPGYDPMKYSIRCFIVQIELILKFYTQCSGDTLKSIANSVEVF